MNTFLTTILPEANLSEAQRANFEALILRTLVQTIIEELPEESVVKCEAVLANQNLQKLEVFLDAHAPALRVKLQQAIEELRDLYRALFL